VERVNPLQSETVGRAREGRDFTILWLVSDQNTGRLSLD
jgi:hypothetical protein